MNRFFKILVTHPDLLWKAGACLLFMGLGSAMFFLPTLARELDPGTRTGFSALLFLYGVYRGVTFFVDYNSAKRDAE
ncbi:MAG: hypothetical protein NZM35_06735 [Chitinophagales bacterium]|nr:hypothetical protein [Chitinophagales bacterium]MDW8418942.1 hypothetical protein [Chitinophagales bacterium]